MPLRSLPTRLRWLALAPAARPLRFTGTGAAAGATQLLLLAALTRAGWDAIAANVVAFLLATQLNFTISQTVTWRDRRLPGSLPRRWLLFHASIAAMATLNMVTFVIAHTVAPTLAASAAGIAVAAAGNYLAGDHFVFRNRAGTSFGASAGNPAA
jgi:putative flippase GtrA